MLEGKRPLSIKDAYYIVEASYGNLLLSHDEYTALIKSNATFIRQWLIANNYVVRNPESLYSGIQKFLSDALYAAVNKKSPVSSTRRDRAQQKQPRFTYSTASSLVVSFPGRSFARATTFA